MILRNLAGLAIRDIENDVANNCGKTITEEVYNSFSNNKRKTRQAVLTSLHNDIYVSLREKNKTALFILNCQINCNINFIYTVSGRKFLSQYC